MPSPFDITVATNTVTLDNNRQGIATFTVKNITRRHIRATVRVAVQPTSGAAWVTIVPAEGGDAANIRDFPVDATAQIQVKIAAPPSATAGTYTIQLTVADETNPDDNFATSPDVVFSVPEPTPVKKQAFPVWIIPVIVIGIIVIGGGIFFATRSSTPPTPTATTVPPTVTIAPTPTLFGGGQAEIAFESDFEGNQEVYVIDIDQNGKVTNQRNLTKNPASDGSPAWSPDGQQIAFFSQRLNHYDIWVMNADGSNPHPITNDAADDGDPSWSPDGKTIAFESNRDVAAGSSIYVMDTDGSNVRRRTSGTRVDYFPVWSPDGKQIAFMGREPGGLNDVYVMDADGSNLHKITDNPAQDGNPAWSPDGKQIAFFSQRDNNYEIYVMNADGSNQHRITNHIADDGDPAWSPDGSQIAFESNRDSGSNKSYNLYLMNPLGENRSRLTTNQGIDEFPAWRP